jgi:hypothetical protein
MSWGFEDGKVYNRRADIHAKFGGALAPFANSMRPRTFRQN